MKSFLKGQMFQQLESVQYTV